MTHTKLVNMTLIPLFSVVIAVCSWIAIPAPVPFTFQTFAVFLTLELLGGKRGTLAVLVYILLGALGLPVFFGFSGGLGALLGATGGYILGFLLMSLAFWGICAIKPESAALHAAALVVGLCVCYAFGTAWFMVVYARNTGAIGLSAALGMCVVPFILPDLAKLSLAFTLARRLKKRLPK